MRKRIALYLAFAVLFWGPFYLLIHFEKVTANIAVIAAAIGVAPVILLSASLMETVARRVSSVKVAGIEVDLRREMTAVVKGSAMEQVAVTIDPGREVIYGKADLTGFAAVVRRHFPQRTKRLVLLVDLKDGEDVYLPMLFFQTHTLLGFFDLRAVLFVDSRQPDATGRILGTVEPATALQRIENVLEGLEDAYKKALKETQVFLASGQIDLFIQRLWSEFASAAALPDRAANSRLSDYVFRFVFADQLEANLLRVPLTEGDYHKLLSHLQPSRRHIILTDGKRVVNVRSIDSVAREIARATIVTVMRRPSAASTDASPDYNC